MADLDVVAYLASKGVQTFPAKGDEVTAHCWFCPDGNPKGKGKMYINTADGWYDCKRCGNSGGTYLMQKHFGDEPKAAVHLPGSDPAVRRQILTLAADLGSQMLYNNDEVLLYLVSERGLSPETVIERKLGWVGGGWSLVGSLPKEFAREDIRNTSLVYRDGPRAGQDFFYNHILIPYLSRGAVVQIRGKVKDAKYFTGPGDDSRLYGVDDLDDAEDVIITEGEFDAMVLKQHLSLANDDRARRIAVVGLPGATGFAAGWENYFAGVRRVYLGLDPDDTGKREALKIKERLGTRARIIELPGYLPKCDWTEYLLPIPVDANSEWKAKHPHAGHTWRDVVALLGKSAGKRLFSVAESAHAFRTMRAEADGIKTGYVQLDATIEPGLLPGQVTVVLAKTGVGKTLMLCNMAYHMRSRRVLFISLEMTREEVYDRLRKIYLFYHPRATDAELEFALGNIMICDENRLSDKDIAALAEEYEVEVGQRPEVVMVDYLGYFARGQKGNGPYEKVTNAVMQLKEEAKGGSRQNPSTRFHIIVPAQVNRLAKEGKPIDLDDARDSGAIEETADFMVSIYRPDDALRADTTDHQQTGIVRMTILKSRHGGKGRTFSLMMDLLTLAIVDDKTSEAERATNHNYMYWRGQRWADLRALETAPRQLSIAGGSA